MTAIEGPLRRRHGFGDFLYWNAMAAIPLVTGGLAIFHRSGGWLLVYGLAAIALLGLVYRRYCTHCPHYTAEGRTTRCLFFWGMPKFFSPRPGPLTLGDKVCTLAAAGTLFLFPMPWLIFQPGLLVVYLLSCAILAATLVRQECRRCIYFDCPANRVPDHLRQQAE